MSDKPTHGRGGGVIKMQKLLRMNSIQNSELNRNTGRENQTDLAPMQIIYVADY